MSAAEDTVVDALMRINNEAITQVRSLTKSRNTVERRFRRAVRELVQHLDEPVAIVGREGGIVWNNEAFTTFCGDISPRRFGDVLMNVDGSPLGALPGANELPGETVRRLRVLTLSGGRVMLTMIPDQGEWIVLVTIPHVEVADLDVLTALNNEVVNVSRQVAQKNRQLEIARAEITKQNAELERLATTDVLTGIPNRQALLARLAREWATLGSREGLLSVVLGDIDHFKAYNDRFGHDTGDRVLVHVAQALAAASGRGGFAARYGGEEFVLLLPVDGAAEAAVRVEGIRAQMAASSLEIEGYVHRVTMSFGVVVVGAADVGTSQQALSRADASLYEAKHAGRNRVVVHPGDLGCFEARQVV